MNVKLDMKTIPHHTREKLKKKNFYALDLLKFSYDTTSYFLNSVVLCNIFFMKEAKHNLNVGMA